MEGKSLKTLEFYKIREQLMSFASSSLGRERAESLVPATSLEDVITLQEETDEAATVLRLKGHAPLGGIFNIRPQLKRAEIGGMLNASELVEVASTIYASRMIRAFEEQLSEEGVDLPIFHGLISEMPILTGLEHEIKQSIDDNGEILDGASPALRSIRSQRRLTEGRVREKLESMVRSRNAQKMLSDAIVTIRNDRYVLPVKQEYRGHYGGIVHDQSSSGQTLFIEPESVVQLNNSLRELRVKEQTEIEKILLELSGRVSEVTEDLSVIINHLAHIDFMFTKAKYGRSIKGTKPSMNDKGRIKLFKARHPLLGIEEAVANDIFLGEDFTTIVITGPNTGGKTVTLKTIGICTLLAQAGLPIPALDGSELAVFQSVYADIGDEQSIEQSLSTFSSHMVNIVDILDKVDFQSLVLFDELGAGTDPQEGAALAISILDYVYKRGARVVATTHYPELKAYGYNREGVVNASVEFDVETLRPTYRLLLGVPGRSNAFEISKRLGLSDDVIDYAKAHIGTDSKQVENMIASLEESKRMAEKERMEANELLKSADKLHRDLQKQTVEYYEKKDELVDKAKDKAIKIVEEAKREAEEIIRELRNLRIQKNAEVKEHELIEAKKRLEDATPTKNMKKTQASRTDSKELRPGDDVKVLSFGQKGVLLEKTGEAEWAVQMGILKMKVETKDIEFVSRKKEKVTKPLATVKGKDYHVSLELDLRGERYDHALNRVEKYIDDALLASYPRVSIIHGKGTGALRKGVQEYLKNHRSVKSIRFGEAGEGGTGVTVVEFK
ncbi:recombination and DNA strand exchange inhibitor protein [Bacillus coahuilensis p1.1.43]|uniref:Endonuclease MutS2 n=1 Tax=Bacillus coahuilensis p1.1.43 TaxID=1150625 RepID=A0A147K6Z9_9BACI|nr:endonuclease MutS2 [Bacillus coahuilensis]KUP05752.1 recombination and DNA strand exchange inhibitor protein [Bacillus coahuilensis p1.1.43]